MSTESAPTQTTSSAGRFGTFGGVFTPSILTILGVVMYLLLGKVTGQAGLLTMLLIVVVAHLLSIATGLSVASIATNRKVGAGGAYFMISRSLGASSGAAIGIPLFFAQALSVTFYIVGFTDSLVPLLPESLRPYLPPVLIGSLVNLLLTALSLKSADLAIKAQYVVMVAIGVSLVSFFAGTTSEFPRAIEWVNPAGPSFGELFAIFFPAVTGLMAGVGMSGDLKDPRRSIPIGTMAAILVGMLVYVSFPIWLSLNVSNAELIENDRAVWRVALVPQLIYVGVWGATLSSALGSILTAPRTLQALAVDGLAPRFLGKGYGATNEPRVGTLLTFAMAQVGIFLGSLDAIAPVLTMFFLVTYGMTNLSCGLEQWAASPSYRPSFRVPTFVAIAGGVGCFWVMSFISVPAMAAAMVFCIGIYLIVERRTLSTTYGDARHGIWAALVRSSLYRLRQVVWHPQNWRPNLIILGGDPRRRSHLLDLGSALVQERGVVTYFHLLEGTVSERAERRRELFAEHDLKIAKQFPNVFFRVDIVPDVFTGTVQVAQTYGIGSFEANSVMLGWSTKQERAEAYVQMCRDLAVLDRSLLLVSYDEERKFGEGKLLHIWWGGLEGNGGLMLLLAFLLTAHYQWRQAKVVVLTVVDSEAERERTIFNLERLLAAARLDAEPRVLLRRNRPINEIMRDESANADMAILGFRLPDPGMPAEPFFDRMNAMLDELPTTLLVHGARNFQSEPVLFDEGLPSVRPPEAPTPVIHSAATPNPAAQGAESPGADGWSAEGEGSSDS